MLVELAVRDLGVIAELRLGFASGMTALTGETGAGKTMIVEAIGLLLGARTDPGRVRPGAEETVVEGLFVVGDTEWVLRRVVPRTGRSRSYVNGALAPATRLAELGADLVELHGQHAQQWLFRPANQRAVLDRFGDVDLTDLVEARRRVAELEAALAELGGDERMRAREIDLLRYQHDELVDAGLDDPDEDARLATEEETLADAVAHREAGGRSLEVLTEESGVIERLAVAVAALDHRAPYEAIRARLAGVGAELDDVTHELRVAAEAIEEQPDRLEELRARRQRLAELRRKYGETLAAVIEERDSIAARLESLTSYDERAARLGDELGAAGRALDAAARRVGEQRRAAAEPLARAIEVHAAQVALAGARVEVAVDDETSPAGDGVELRIATNRGMEPRPLAQVASGGELSRTMLALHLVFSAGPPTMVFDEVDAGIGGSTGTEIGRALARLARDRQVLVVTHLPQVAAFADHQLSVVKGDDGAMTTTSIATLDDDARVIELSRMLSGSPDSAVAHAHAGELLDAAASERGELERSR